MWSVPRNYTQDSWELSSARETEKTWRYSSVESEFCTGGCEDRTWEREAEEFPQLEAVARERLSKTVEAG
jgi:hypothetical protein